MSHSYTDAAQFDSAITLPDDGDQITAASVNVALEALADRTRALSQRVLVADIYTSFSDASGLVGSTCETLSYTEAAEYASITCSGDNAVVKAGDKIVVDLRCHAVITGSQAIGSAMLTGRTTTSGGVQVYPLAVLQAVTEIDNFKTSSGMHIPIAMTGVIEIDDIVLVGADYVKLGLYGKVSALGGVLRLNKPVWSRMQVWRAL